jgi:hypothetical protein
MVLGIIEIGGDSHLAPQSRFSFLFWILMNYCSIFYKLTLHIGTFIFIFIACFSLSLFIGELARKGKRSEASLVGAWPFKS